MRSPAIAILSLFAVATTTVAHAEVPNPIVALLGPSVGYMLSQSDLCQWNLADKIKKTFQDDFKAIGMTDAQQATAWALAAEAQKRLAGMPDEAKARMKTDTCNPASRLRVDHDLAD
jgi:hypothetical protein